MVGKDFEVGDLVWAKMKGYPFWPARVEKPPQNQKSVKKAQHFVFFFGSENYAWVLDEFILPHSEERVASCTKKKSSSLQSAIDEIVNLSKKVSKKSSTPIKEEFQNEDAETHKRPQLSADKKAGKVQKKVLVPKKEKHAKVQKRVPKKRHLADSGVTHHSSPAKSRRVDDDYSALLANVPPSTGYSRVAVIHPYDDDSALPQTSGILTRPDYIERPSTPSLDIMKVSDTLQVKNITATTKKIGFIGLGLVGRGVVKNLLNSGHDVTVWNRSPEKCAPFVNAGACQGLTPSDVVARCDITFCCVADPEAAKTMVFGNCGVLQGLEGCVAGSKGYVEMSTIDPITSQEIAEAISHVGGRYLEAPVSGSRTQSEEGSLLILGAGDRDLFNDCESCFFSFSKNAYYLSCVVGSGSKMKLILSMLMGTCYAALAEAMALIERSKLSQGNFLEILDLGPLSCPLLMDKGQAMLQRNFSTNTALKHQQKDLNLALSLGNECDQPLLITSAANELFKHAKLLRYADHDVSAVLLGAKY